MATAELEKPSSSPSESTSTDADSTVSLRTVIEARPGWQAVNLKELWQYRELVFFLTWRDIKVRYKQTVMGAAWAIIQPLMTSIVFVILFGKFGRMEENTNLPFFPLVFASQIAWQFFAASISQSGQSLVSSANLISKVYFPRLIVPIASVGAGLVDFTIALGVMALILFGSGLIPPLQVVLLPLFLLGVIVTAIGVGSLLAALTVAYRDFRYVIPFLVQMWMFASPVGYPLVQVTGYLQDNGISESWMWLYFANPMAGFAQGFRWCLLGAPFELKYLAISTTMALLILTIGLAYFRKVERRFADIV